MWDSVSTGAFGGHAPEVLLGGMQGREPPAREDVPALWAILSSQGSESDEFREHKENIGRNAGRMEERVCKECGVLFEQRVYSQLRDFCSKRCARNNWKRVNPDAWVEARSRARHARRARMLGRDSDNIGLSDVAKRDGWRCGICGRKVNPRLRYPHRMSASLDHIQPLAKGGSHTWGNVTVAHFICNSRKRDMEGGQLPLRMES